MGNWKRGLRLAAPLLILPLGFLAYRPLNQWVILPWLGCGCPVMDAAGNLRAPVFCANDFTRLTALLLAAGALVFAVVNLRRLEKARTKWLYMAVCAVWIGLLAVGFVRAQLWKWALSRGFYPAAGRYRRRGRRPPARWWGRRPRR